MEGQLLRTSVWRSSQRCKTYCSCFTHELFTFLLWSSMSFVALIDDLFLRFWQEMMCLGLVHFQSQRSSFSWTLNISTCLDLLCVPCFMSLLAVKTQSNSAALTYLSCSKPSDIRWLVKWNKHSMVLSPSAFCSVFLLLLPTSVQTLAHLILCFLIRCFFFYPKCLLWMWTSLLPLHSPASITLTESLNSFCTWLELKVYWYLRFQYCFSNNNNAFIICHCNWVIDLIPLRPVPSTAQHVFASKQLQTVSDVSSASCITLCHHEGAPLSSSTAAEAPLDPPL